MQSIYPVKAGVGALYVLLSFWSLNASAQAPWCTPGSNFDCQFGDVIHHFSTTNGQTNITNNASGCSPNGYSYVSGQTVSQLPGAFFDFSVQTDPSNLLDQGFAIWVDWNDDHDFSDPGEDVWNSGSAGSGAFTGTITLPASPSVFDTLRLRLRCNRNGVPSDPCASQTHGEVEDYNLVLLQPLSASVDPVPDLDCFGDSSGVAYSTSTGGVPPYTYLWSTGDSTDTVSGLPAGTYSLVVSDSLGGVDTTSFVIGQTTQIVTTSTTSGTLTCSGDSNGWGTVMATGGTQIEGYDVDTTKSNFSPEVLTGATSIPLGDDAVSFAIPLGFSFEFFGNTYTDIYLASNGFVTFTNVGGSGCCAGPVIPTPAGQDNLIALAWDDLFPPGNGTIEYQTLGTAPNRRWVCNYSGIPICCVANPNVTSQVILYETTNCIEIHNTNIFGVSPATQGIENLAGTEAYVYPGRNGSAWTASNDFISFCPSQAYQYAWPSGATTPTDSGLSAGVYPVTVTDANGCQAVENVVIGEPAPLTWADSGQTMICFGEQDGTINLDVFGAVPPYTIQWNNGSTGANLTGLGADSLWATLTDSLGCTAMTDTFVIQENPAFTVTLSGQDVTCFGDQNGMLGLTVSGSVPPYSVIWNNGLSGTSLTGLGPVSLWASITDSVGCTFSTDTVSILEPPVLNVAITSFTDVTCEGGNDGSVTAQVSGGTPPYALAWSPGGQTGPTLSGISAGTQTVTATDSNGCIETDQITLVELNALPETNLGNDTIICNGDSLTLIASPGYTYNWNVDPNNTTATQVVDSTLASPGVPVDVVVVLSDPNGCVNSDTIVITIADCVGLAEWGVGPEVSVFPNPSEGMIQLTVSGTAPLALDLIVSNAQGQLVRQESILARVGTLLQPLDLSTEAPGVYFIRLSSTLGSTVIPVVLR